MFIHCRDSPPNDQAELWTDTDVRCDEWCVADGVLCERCFWLDVMVAKGLVLRSWKKKRSVSIATDTTQITRDGLIDLMKRQSAANHFNQSVRNPTQPVQSSLLFVDRTHALQDIAGIARDYFDTGCILGVGIPGPSIVGAHCFFNISLESIEKVAK